MLSLLTEVAKRVFKINCSSIFSREIHVCSGIDTLLLKSNLLCVMRHVIQIFLLMHTHQHHCWMSHQFVASGNFGGVKYFPKSFALFC